MIHGISADFRLAARALRSAPVVTFVAVLSLALGIGGLTSIFSVANSLLLRPLPVNDPGRLVTVTSSTALNLGYQAGGGWNYAMWAELHERRAVFDGAFAWTIQQVDLSDGGEMQPAAALIGSGDLFTTLGVPALLGRTFTSADDVRGGGPDGPVIVISYEIWQRRFSGAAEAIGARLPIDGVPFTVIGVMPRGFSGIDVGQPFDLALPFGAEPLLRGARTLLDNQRALLLTVMLRLKPGQSIAEATAALRALQPGIIGAMRQAPQFVKEPFIAVTASTGISDRSRLRQNYQRPLLVIAAVSALVLVVVCLNIANLLLARAAARRHELSVRVAIGATRRRLARQFLAEGLTLAATAAVLGGVFAAWASRVLVTHLRGAGGPAAIDVSLDWRVFAFTGGMATAASVLFGTLPAFYASRIGGGEALRQTGRDGHGDRWQPLSATLIVAQLAISLVLVAAAGLFVRTLDRLASAPLGFDPTGVLIIVVNAARTATPPEARPLLYQRIVEVTRAVPGVAHAGGSVWTPMSGAGGGLMMDARGRRLEGDQVAFNFITPGWFDTYATSRRAGRDISEHDMAGGQRVAIVNEALIRRLFPNQSAVGDTVKAGPCGQHGCTVVGVVADAAYSPSLRDGAPPTVYLPFAQSAGLVPPGSQTFQVAARASGEPAQVVPAIAQALREIDPGLAFSFRPLTADVAAAFTQERLVASLASVFGLLALMLSALGLYGVVAYAVSRRRAEIGIRLALGAPPARIVRLVMRRVCLLGAVGLLLGLAASLWLSRYVAPLLYGLEPSDPVTLVTAALTLSAVGALASWIPASRAARLDPARVLREG